MIFFSIIILIIVLFLCGVLAECFGTLKEASKMMVTVNKNIETLISSVAALSTFMAFWVQYKFNKYQRYDISVERFENKYFELLHIHQNIVAELIITIYDDTDINEIKDVSKEQEEVFKGRDVFDGIYNHILIEDEKGNIYEGLRDVFEHFDICNVNARQQAYELYTSDELVQTLDHYFTFTYQVLNYIDKTDVVAEGEKHKYTDILRSSFNIDELLLLFYHGILIDNNMKTLIEKYALLRNLRREELGNMKVLSLYRDSAY